MLAVVIVVLITPVIIFLALQVQVTNKSQPTASAHYVQESSVPVDGAAAEHSGLKNMICLCGNVHAGNPSPDFPPISIHVTLNGKPPNHGA